MGMRRCCCRGVRHNFTLKEWVKGKAKLFRPAFLSEFQTGILQVHAETKPNGSRVALSSPSFDVILIKATPKDFISKEWIFIDFHCFLWIFSDFSDVERFSLFCSDSFGFL
jgi:hypothetical protein